MVATTPLNHHLTVEVSQRQPTLLETHALTIGYAGKQPRLISQNISITLKAGELVCLIGPNGAGKSTLIRTLAGMQAPLGGKVTLLHDDVHRLPARDLAQRLSVVLTERVNPGLLTAAAVVALGRHPYTDWSGRLNANDNAIVREAIAAVGATALAERQITELSDGERQKIMIARALAQQPVLMILDEPTAFLDLPRRVEMMQLLQRLAHREARAILLSTHDLDLALRTADRIWLMAGDGSLRTGAPEDLVLSGAFAEAFRAEGVDFDAATGAFRGSAAPRATIALHGDDLFATWTRRALERAGFNVTSNGGALAQVEADAGRWQLNHAGQNAEYASVYELVEALKRL